jgi:hypothetical protein
MIALTVPEVAQILVLRALLLVDRHSYNVQLPCRHEAPEWSATRQ